MAVKTTRFDSAEYLDSDEAINAYLEEALETDDPAFITQALGTVARAHGMSQIAKETGLSRESLYKAERRGQSGIQHGHPRHAGARAKILRHGCGATLTSWSPRAITRLPLTCGHVPAPSHAGCGSTHAHGIAQSVIFISYSHKEANAAWPTCRRACEAAQPGSRA